MTGRGSRPQLVPQPVLDAFGATGGCESLVGGEGRSVRVGALVLKPAEDSDETTWAAELLTNVVESGFRVARPVRARDGRWVVDRWSAARLVAGATGPADRWEQLFSAVRAFHGALRPVEADCQLVHGDLSGNVLFADPQPPAIIDLSPYWRPAEYADAVVAVDGLLWFNAGRDLLGLARSTPDFPQMLARALIFRLVALNEQARDDAACLDQLVLFEPVVPEVE